MSVQKIDETKCDGCGICVEACPIEILKINEKGKAYIAYPDACVACLNCLRTCPKDAIYVPLPENADSESDSLF